MKTKKSSQLILTLIILSMFTSFIFSDNIVVGVITEYSFGFENTLIGGQITSGEPVGSQNIFTSVPSSGTFLVSSSYPRSGSRSFYIYKPTTGYGVGNFFANYSNDMYITDFSVWFRASMVSTHTFFIACYNTTLGVGDSPGLNALIVFGHYQGKPAYYNNGVMNYLDTSAISVNTYYQFGFEILNDLGDVRYYSTFKNIDIELYANKAAHIAAGYRIDAIQFYYKYAPDIYVDDINWTISDSYGEEIPSVGCIDITGLQPTGGWGLGGFTVPSEYIVQNYNIPVTTTIKAVELMTTKWHYDSDHDLDQYELYINGINMGNPVCYSDSSYVLQWSMTVYLEDEIPSFTFRHKRRLGSTIQYWQVNSGEPNDDLNGDGSAGFTYSLYESTYTWVWQWGIPPLIRVYEKNPTDTFVADIDLGMKFWATGFYTDEIFYFENTIGLSGYKGMNTTGYLYNISGANSVIICSYTVNATDPYYLRLYIDNSPDEILMYGFPYYANYPGSSISFSPLVSGKYNISLTLGSSYVLNITAWVTGTLGNYVIKTNPGTTYQNEPYNVYYKYYNPFSFDGAIAKDLTRTTLNTFLKCEYQQTGITANTTGTFIYESSDLSAQFWGLYSYYNTYTKRAETTHYIKLAGILTNTLYVLPETLVISGQNENNLGVVIYGTHIFPGSQVNLYVNGVFLAYVGYSQNIEQVYQPYKSGVYEASLRLVQSDGVLYLANYTFYITSSDLTPTAPSEYRWVSDLIPEEYHLIVGVVIIIGCMLLPLMAIFSINSTLQKFNVTINVPGTVTTVMTIISGITGYILTIMWGIMPWESIFLMLFILILIMMIFWLKGGGFGGGTIKGE